jgi:superfamily II DNA/RNA helicase
MLDMGFINEITDLLNQLPKQRQSLFFSATMEPKVASLIEGFSNDAVTISVKTGDTSDNVDQNVVTYTSSVVKIEKLHDILNHERTEKTIIFDETKRNVDRLSQELASRGFSVESLHGDKSQGQRKRALDKFRRSEVTILVATDVAARGIDIADITHVINYSTPQTYDDYVHRIGRAGRAGKTGTALTFITA